METLPAVITIDGIDCKVEWHLHSVLRSIKRGVKIADVENLLEKASALLDLPNKVYCWVRDSKHNLSVLVYVEAIGCKVILHVVTVLNKSGARPCNETDFVIDV